MRLCLKETVLIGGTYKDSLKSCPLAYRNTQTIYHKLCTSLEENLSSSVWTFPLRLSLPWSCACSPGIVPVSSSYPNALLFLICCLTCPTEFVISSTVLDYLALNFHPHLETSEIERSGRYGELMRVTTWSDCSDSKPLLSLCCHCLINSQHLWLSAQSPPVYHSRSSGSGRMETQVLIGGTYKDSLMQ